MTPTPFLDPYHVVPILLRPGLTVHVGGLPLDLTKREAQRIERIVMAMAVPTKPPEG